MPSQSPLILPPDDEGIARAADLLLGGGLVAVPTETVYGLAADATNEAAVARIFAAKGRPGFNPLIVHVPDLDAARHIARVSPEADALASAFWPGALTLVLPLAPDAEIAAPVTAGLSTIAIRVPAHPVMRALLRKLDRPLAAPSANPSGRISATTATHVIDGLGSTLDAVLDAGPCAVGVESTILAPGRDGTRLLREGGIACEAIEAITGPLTADLTPAGSRRRGRWNATTRPACHFIWAACPNPARWSSASASARSDITPVRNRQPGRGGARLFAVLHDAEALALSRGRASDPCAGPAGRGVGPRHQRPAETRIDT
jgi:L-threonylcarbamoyladenylate synthase